jgi:hypothetical protein
MDDLEGSAPQAPLVVTSVWTVLGGQPVLVGPPEIDVAGSVSSTASTTTTLGAVPGDEATVGAWTFGHAYAREKFGSTWKSATISGVFVSSIDERWGTFEWDDGDDDGPVRTRLCNVRWVRARHRPQNTAALSDADAVAVHHARHASLLLLATLVEKLRDGAHCSLSHALSRVFRACSAARGSLSINNDPSCCEGRISRENRTLGAAGFCINAIMIG